jgi:hypothetical protein
MWKLKPWWLVFVMICIFLAACFCAAQAVTFAWLSSFPGRASQFKSLEIKFWSYAIAAVVLIVIDFGLFVRLVRQINRDNARKAD